MASAPPPSAPPSLCPSASSPLPSPPRHSAALRVESSSSDDSLIPAHLHSPILSALCHPGSSLCSVARDFRIAVDILAMWLTEPDTREKMLSIEKSGCAHTRMAASVSLASTVGVLQTIIDDYTEARAHARELRAQHEHLAPGASRHDPLPPSHLNAAPHRAFLPGEAILADTSLQAQRLELRRAEGARRACHHLYRLSRIVPIDDSTLALAHANSVRVPLVPAKRSETEPVPSETVPVLQAEASDSKRAASVSERTPAPQSLCPCAPSPSPSAPSPPRHSALSAASVVPPPSPEQRARDPAA
ncbi:MAG: hypothetical protein KF838_10390 [Phycisphaeraceae bacterium]|nr:MAG: hypothetical protein KF838_10390 [Phycisphaeraceae bacterium]